MPSFLFRNRWIAIAWVLGVLGAVGFFFGGGGRDILDSTAASVQARHAKVEEPVQNPPIVLPPPPPRIIVRQAESPVGAAPETELVEADGAPAAMAGDDIPSDSYVIVDRSASVENATVEDLRARRDER